MALRLHSTQLHSSSTEGEINFTTGPDSWLCYSPTPKTLLPFAPELGEVARIKPEFDKRNVMLALSVDDVNSHNGWVRYRRNPGRWSQLSYLADPDKRFLTSTT